MPKIDIIIDDYDGTMYHNTLSEQDIKEFDRCGLEYIEVSEEDLKKLDELREWYENVSYEYYQKLKKLNGMENK